MLYRYIALRRGGVSRQGEGSRWDSKTFRISREDRRTQFGSSDRNASVPQGLSRVHGDVIAHLGWVAERFNAPVLKTGVGFTLPGVRIPPHPLT